MNQEANTMTAEEKENLLLVAGIPLDKAEAILELVSDHNKEADELKSEIERLKGEAESRAKDAWERACDIQHTICLTSIPETAEKQVYLAVRDCNKPTYQS